jgi:hypothetical protein
VTLASLLEERLGALVDVAAIDDSLRRSKASVKKWRKRYGLPGT